MSFEPFTLFLCELWMNSIEAIHSMLAFIAQHSQTFNCKSKLLRGFKSNKTHTSSLIKVPNRRMHRNRSSEDYSMFMVDVTDNDASAKTVNFSQMNNHIETHFYYTKYFWWNLFFSLCLSFYFLSFSFDLCTKCQKFLFTPIGLHIVSNTQLNFILNYETKLKTHIINNNRIGQI